ncbi:MAG: hypothetical protein P8J17_17260 [Halioglobus sp.]|nr:hypothetical protein [Halioglobus sp.]
MPETSVSDLGITIEALGESLPDFLKWEWDDRFDGVLAAFEITEKDRILAVLAARFGQAWDLTNISDAPEGTRAAIQGFGGLTANQLLFTSDWNQGVVLLGFWWPWGNGANISIRFVPYGLDASGSDIESVKSAFKIAFGV